MTPSELKKHILKTCKTPAARAIGERMYTLGRLTVYVDAKGFKNVEVIHGTRRYFSGIPSFNTDFDKIPTT